MWHDITVLTNCLKYIILHLVQILKIKYCILYITQPNTLMQNYKELKLSILRKSKEISNIYKVHLVTEVLGADFSVILNEIHI